MWEHDKALEQSLNAGYNLPAHPMVLIFIVVTLYFLPLIIAVIRNMPNTIAISVLNAVAGWTFVGWVAALVWACLDKTKENHG